MIPWIPGELEAWIVAAALISLTRIIDMGTGQVDISDFRDRAAAIQALQILQDGGEAFEPSEIGPWAMANGWDMAAARELQEIAEKTRKGVRLRGSRQAGQRWAADALQQWRQAAVSSEE